MKIHPFLEDKVDKKKVYSGPAKDGIIKRVRLSSGRYWTKIKNSIQKRIEW